MNWLLCLERIVWYKLSVSGGSGLLKYPIKLQEDFTVFVSQEVDGGCVYQDANLEC